MSQAVQGQSSLMGLVCASKQREKGKGQSRAAWQVWDHPEQQSRPGCGRALHAVALAAGALQSPSAR